MPRETPHHQYRAERYFPQLDGLRAVSILLVIAYHTADPMWTPIHGYLGVTLFFVLSGYLITTLLLREEEQTGAVSLSGFYIRRVFRIVPLYLLALALFTFLVLGLGLGQGGAGYLERLPLLATFNGEFAGEGTFNHSWSLGIEEKFYLLWPLLGFALVTLRRARPYLLATLLAAALAGSFTPGLGYLGIYAPILAGCALGLLLHTPRTYGYVHALARPLPAVAAWTLVVVAMLLDRRIPLLDDQSPYGHAVFGVAAALALPSVLVGHNVLRSALSNRGLVHFGTLAYAVYLFHPMAVEVADRLIAAGQSSVALQLVRFVLAVAISAGIAEVLSRTIEKPMIRVGRRLTRSGVAPQQLPSSAR